MKPEAKMEYPETPAWTMFFDGPLYQRYKEFMQEKDFSKILLTNKLQLANTADPETHSEQQSKHEEWWETDIDAEQEKIANPNIYSSVVSEDFYRNLKDDRKRTKRRTRAFILLGFVILAALAFGTALVIHYFIIPSDKGPSSNMNISLNDNVSSTFANLSGIASTKVTIAPVTIAKPQPNDLSNLLDRFVTKHVEKDVEKSGKTSKYTTTSSVTTVVTTSTTQSTTPREPTTTVKDITSAGSTLSVIDTSTFKTVETSTTAVKPTTESPVTSYEDLYDLFGMDDDASTTSQAEGEETVFVTTESSTWLKTTLATTTSELPQYSTTTDSITETTSYTTSSKDTTTNETPTTSTSTSAMTSTGTHAVTDLTTEGTTGLDFKSTEATTESYTDTYSQNATTGLSTETYNQTVSEAITQTSASPTNTTFTSVVQEISSIIQTTTDEKIPTSHSTTENVMTSSTLLQTTPLQTTIPPSTTALPTTSSTGTPSTVPPSTTSATTTAPITSSMTTNQPYTTLQSTSIPTTVLPTTTVAPPTTTTVQQTTLPEHYTTDTDNDTTMSKEKNETFNIVTMETQLAYTGEVTRINCHVKYAVHWKYLLIREKMFLSPLTVRVFPDGKARWSWSREERHDVSIELINQDGLGTDISVDLIISDVQCKDSKIFQCFLYSDLEKRNASSKLMVVGKPSNQMHLTIGPSIIEDKALRLTAEWTAGYPTPWTNISWLAIDFNNKTYNLENYGQYREYEIKVDHQRCETRLKNSFVIFPTMELNDTTVMIKPNLKTIKKFVSKEMAVGLNNVRSGSEKILVIPLNYCQSGKKESAVPHPYTVCNKYIRCTKDDLIVQQCPGGTCFYKGMIECA